MNESTTPNDVPVPNPILNLAASQPNAGDVSPLEQEVLDEYSRLLKNMNHLNTTLSTLSKGPITVEIAEGLRLLERKVASVYTLMKASVYSIVLQQGESEAGMNENGGGIGGGGGGVREESLLSEERTVTR